jgi:hypothetical protein
MAREYVLSKMQLQANVMWVVRKSETGTYTTLPVIKSRRQLAKSSETRGRARFAQSDFVMSPEVARIAKMNGERKLAIIY